MVTTHLKEIYVNMVRLVFACFVLVIAISLPSCYGVCQDQITDCADYTTSACSAPYDTWARRNCPLFCGFCSPSCGDSIPDCAEYGKQACAAPYLSWAKSNCANYCGFCSSVAVPTKSPTTAQQTSVSARGCAYKGQYYAIGETWLDGCDYRCTCSSLGLTQCTQPCTVIASLPSFCHAETVPGQCCKRIVCDINATSSVSSLDQGCRYKNQTYGKGQTWMDGCDYRCTCERNDIVQCVTPCLEYKNLPSTCQYETVPGDCCKNVRCSITGNEVTGGGADKCTYRNQTYSVGEVWKDGCDYNCTCLDGLVTHCSTLCNEFVRLPSGCHYESVPGQCCRKLVCVDTTSSSFIDRGGCTYKDQKYQTGDIWQEGCSVNCTCVDSRSGHYDCVDTCPTVHLSDGCSLVKRNGKCCPEAVCDLPNVNTTKTLSSDFQGCVYKDGSIYQLGDMWYDECQWKCYCNRNLFYNCESRCMEFHLPSQCSLDPPPPGKCCKVPRCPPNYLLNLPPGYVQE
ncbi:putative epidermal cell surface receptor [Crassostrea virginica]